MQLHVPNFQINVRIPNLIKNISMHIDQIALFVWVVIALLLGLLRLYSLRRVHHGYNQQQQQQQQLRHQKNIQFVDSDAKIESSISSKIDIQAGVKIFLCFVLALEAGFVNLPLDQQGPNEFAIATATLSGIAWVMLAAMVGYEHKSNAGHSWILRVILLLALIPHILSLLQIVSISTRNWEQIRCIVQISGTGIVSFLLMSSVCTTGFAAQPNSGDDDDDCIDDMFMDGSSNHHHQQEQQQQRNGRNRRRRRRSPRDVAPLFSAWTFFWIHPLMRTAMKRPLEDADIPELAAESQPELHHTRFLIAWEEELSKSDDNSQPSLFRAFWKVHGSALMWQTIICLFAEVGNLGGPYMLNIALTALNNGDVNFTNAVYYSLGFFGFSVMRSLFIHNLWMGNMITGMRMKYSLVDLAYKKGIFISPKYKLQHSTGNIQTLISTDIDSLTTDLLPFVHWWFVSNPLIIAVASYFLYNLVGISFVIGISLLIPLMPLSFLISKKMKLNRKELLSCRDDRTRAIAELVRCIFVGKLLSLIDPRKVYIQKIRNKELAAKLKNVFLSSANAFLWDAIPVAIPLVTFSYFCLVQHGTINLPIAFASISWLSILQTSITNFPGIYSRLLFAHVSWNRLWSFLMCSDTDPIPTLSDDEYVESSFVAKDLLLTWPTQEQSQQQLPCFRASHIQFPRVGLTLIVGPVGCGKSSLLSAISNGDILRSASFFGLRNSQGVALVDDEPWIAAASVRDNIIIGSDLDLQKYNQVIAECQLQLDLSLLPQGDRTLVGHRGVGLSGGQKARVALARAAYHKSEVVVLDDPCSALDAAVSLSVFERCICETMAKTKAVIMSTHDVRFFPKAKHLVVLKNGEIVAQGRPDEIMELPNVRQILCEVPRGDSSPRKSKSNKKQTNVEGELTEIGIVAEEESMGTRGDDDNVDKTTDETTALLEKVEVDENQEDGEEERKGVGGVSLTVYKAYISAFGVVLAVVVGCVLLMYVGSNLAQSLWLGHWATASSLKENATVQMQIYFVAIYAACLSGQVVVTVIKNSLFLFGGYRASKVMHGKLLENVFNAPISFFESIPTGRIINRFSYDTASNDDSVPMIFSYFTDVVVQAVAGVAMIIYASPWFIIGFIPVTVCFVIVGMLYRSAARDLKRMLGIALSPIYSQIESSLEGTTYVKAMLLFPSFSSSNKANIRHWMLVSYHEWMCNQFAAMYMDFLGTAIVLLATFLCLFEAGRGTLQLSFAAVAITYAMQTSSNVMWLIRNYTDLEVALVSTERIHEFCQLESEATYLNKNSTQPLQMSVCSDAWPKRGSISLENVSVRYKPNAPIVLNQVSFEIENGQRVGICGRSGAGKSTLIRILFRILDPTKGRVLVDGVDIRFAPLSQLRTALAIVPQDPLLFLGSLRSNIDPNSIRTDAELWEMLESVGVAEKVRRMAKGLDSEIASSGDNLSMGERQMLCLARALLRDSRVLILDEATANMDHVSDRTVQKVLAGLQNISVIAIAHRLETLYFYDKIVVMSNGQVVEVGNPKQLLQKQGGWFAEMNQHTDNKQTKIDY